MKRSWAILISVMLLLVPALTAVAATNFPDAAGHWAEDEIAYLEAQGIITGFPDGTFGVAQTMTRAQVAQVIFNEQGLTPQTPTFPDVPVTHWASDAIGALNAAGIISGFPDGTFRPEDSLTRAQAAVLIANAYGLSGTGAMANFADVPVTHWAFASVDALTDNLVVAGYPDGTFKPDQTVTRAEFAVLIARVLDVTFTQPLQIMARAALVVEALGDEDMDALAGFAHPTEGIRFSPYEYVVSSHLVFSVSALPGFLNDTTVYTWGAFDGTGDPIEKTPQEYFDRFVMNHDYSNPDQIVFDTVMGRGSMINNIQDFYPDGVFIEYHLEGFDPQYGGMDWGSLFLVFEEYQGEWFVVGIVHGEWTI